jgi:hypothetical protein
MNAPDLPKCTQCEATGLESGFIEDTGKVAKGYARWIPGAVEKGFMGAAKVSGKPRWQVQALRCPSCAHLELFASEQVRP